MALSERLKLARSSLNLTLHAVEGRTGIGVSTLSEFENGKREPRLVQLKHLADAYLRPVTFFLEEGPESSQIVLWRNKPDSPFAEELQAQLVRLGERYHHLETLCNALEPFNLPFHTGPAVRFADPMAEKLAHQSRQMMGLGERPGQALLRVLEEVCKIKVFHLDFESTGSSACTLSESFGAAILLNAKNVRWRRNFDLAYELFHLLTWKTFRCAGESGAVEASEAEEKFATCFARNLLVPPDVLRFALDEAPAKQEGNLSYLLELARQFDVPVEEVIWQITSLDRKAEAWATMHLKQLRREIGSCESLVADPPSALPLRFHVLARHALRQGLFSAAKYAEYVGVSRRRAMQMVEEDSEEDPGFETPGHTSRESKNNKGVVDMVTFTPADVVAAARRYNEKGWPSNYNWAVLVEGIYYPVKIIVAIMRKCDPADFHTHQAIRELQRLGFPVAVFSISSYP